MRRALLFVALLLSVVLIGLTYGALSGEGAASNSKIDRNDRVMNPLNERRNKIFLS